MDQGLQATIVCIMNSRHAWTLWDSVSKQAKKNKLEKEWAMNSGLYLYFKLSWGRRLLVDQTFFLSYWPGNSQRFPGQFRLLESLVDSQNLRVRLYCWRIIYSIYRDEKVYDWAEMEASFLLATFHSVGCLSSGHWGVKKHHFQLGTTCDNIKLPGKAYPLVK